MRKKVATHCCAVWPCLTVFQTKNIVCSSYIGPILYVHPPGNVQNCLLNLLQSQTSPKGGNTIYHRGHCKIFSGPLKKFRRYTLEMFILVSKLFSTHKSLNNESVSLKIQLLLDPKLLQKGDIINDIFPRDLQSCFIILQTFKRWRISFLYFLVHKGDTHKKIRIEENKTPGHLALRKC